MSAGLVDISEAVKTTFAAAHAAVPSRLSQDVTVERVYSPKWKIDQLTEWDHTTPAAGAIRLTVTPAGEEQITGERLRGIITVQYRVYVAVVAKPKTTDPADVDPLLLLLEEARDYFFKSTSQPAYLLAGRQERAVAIETINHPDAEALLGKRQFVGDFLLTFQGVRVV